MAVTELRRKASLVLSIIVLVILLLVAGGVLFIKSDYAASRMCNMIKEGLATRLGLEVTIGSCNIELLPPTLQSMDLEIRGPSGGHLLRVGILQVELDSWALLAGRIRLDRISLDQPEIHLAIANGKLVDLPVLQGGGEDTGDGSTLFPDSIDIHDARVNLVIEKTALAQLREIQLRAVVKGESEFDVAVEVGGGSLDLAGGSGASFPVDSFKLKAGIRKKRVHLDYLALRMGEFAVNAQGALDMDGDAGQSSGFETLSSYRPEINATVTLPLGDLETLLPDFLKMEGVAVVNVRSHTGEEGLQLTGGMDLKNFGIKDAKGINFQTRFTVDSEILKLQNFSGSVQAGSIAGDAQLDLNEPWAFKGSIAIEDASLTESLALGGIHSSPVSLRAAGKVDFQGRFKGEYGPYVILNSQLGIENCEVRVPGESGHLLSFASGKIRAGAAFTGRRVRFPPFRLKVGKSVLEGEGKIYFRSGATTAEVHASMLDLEDFSPIAELDTRGQGTLDAKLEGSLDRPDLKVDLDLDGSVVADYPIGSVRGSVKIAGNQMKFYNLTVARRASALWMNGKMGIQAPYPLGLLVDVGGVKLEEVVAVATGKAPPGWLEGLLGGKVEATGTLESPALAFEIGFQDVRVGGQLFQEGGMVGRVHNGAWHLDLFEARMGPGWLFARGDISRDLVLDVSAYSTGLKTESFPVLDEWKDLLDFRLDLRIALKGPLRSPSFTGWAKAYDTHVQGKKIGDSSVTAQATTESIEIAGRFLGGEALLTTRADLAENLPFKAKLEFATERLGRFLPRITAGKRPRGTIRGQLEGKGLLLVPGQIESELRFDEILFEASGMRVSNRGPVELGLKGGTFQVKQCEIAGPKTAMRVSGQGSFRQGLQMTAEGTVDLELLPLLFDFLPRAAGRANVQLLLRGPMHSPALSGSAGFSADFLRVGGFSQDLSQVTGRLKFTPNIIEVTRVNGRLGGGRFTGQGSIELVDLAFRRLALNFDLEKVRYNVTKDLWGVGTGTINLRGSSDERFLLSGQVRIHEGSYREKYSLASLSQGIFKRRMVKTRTYSSKREVIGFNLRLDMPDDFHVDYNLDLVSFRAKMKGGLRVTGTNERLGLLGEMEAIEGTVNYLTKDFSIVSTRVEMTDEFSIRPKVDVLASLTETVDRGESQGGETDYRVDLHLFAEGDKQPEISLKSEPPLDERDIITLLHLGVTSQDVESLKSEDLVGLGGEILSRSFKLNEKLKTVFPFPPEVIQPKYLRVRSRFSTSSSGERTGSISPRLEVGAKLRFISNDLELDYGRSLYDDTDQNVDLTYRLSRSISTRLRWENANEQSSTANIGDIGLDLKFHWEW